MPHRHAKNGMRTCVGTREVHAQNDLIRWFVGPDKTHWPDWTGRTRNRFGKGRYTQRTSATIEQAIDRRQLKGNKDVLLKRVSNVAEQAFLDRLGLACRANALAIGQTAVRDVLKKGQRQGLLICAEDAGKAGIDRVHDRVLQRGTPVVKVEEGARLGQALGREYVSCVWCEESAFSQTLWSWAPAMATLDSLVISVRLPTADQIRLEAPSPKG